MLIGQFSYFDGISRDRKEKGINGKKKEDLRPYILRRAFKVSDCFEREELRGGAALIQCCVCQRKQWTGFSALELQ